MMYFVALRLQEPFDNYPDLRRALEALGPWSNRLGDTWLVESAFGATRIRDLLKPHIKAGDRLFVGQFSQNWAGTGMGNDFPDWLKRRKFDREAPVKH
jgi:hypothetical protein